MKKIIILIVAVCFTLITSAQNSVKKGLTVGTTTTGVVNISNDELKSLSGVTSAIQTQLNARPTLAELEALSEPAYSNAQIDSLLNVYRFTSSLHFICGSNVLTTSNTNNAVIYTDTIPANSIGANGTFHIQYFGISTGTAATKYINVKFNETEVSRIQIAASNFQQQGYTYIANNNSLTNQSAPGTGSGSSSIFAGTNIAPAAYTFNTAADIIVTVTVQVTSPDTAGFGFINILGIN